MAAQMGGDKYANVLYDEVTESGVDTLTFESIDVGLNIFDKVGLLINRIEYSSVYSRLILDADAVEFGMSASNGFGAADPSESSIIDFNRLSVQFYGTSASMDLQTEPFVKDFSTMPGGGILITPKPWYLFIEGAGLAAVATVKARVFFTVLKLKAEEYFELLESRQFFG